MVGSSRELNQTHKKEEKGVALISCYVIFFMNVLTQKSDYTTYFLK